jgi:uncharacterized protein YceH (UPF0502 family)
MSSRLDAERAERKAKDFVKGVNKLAGEVEKLKKEVADLQRRVRQLEAQK